MNDLEFKELVFATQDGVIVKGKFDKHFENDDYELHFNTETGFEVLKGKGEKEDPFS